MNQVDWPQIAAMLTVLGTLGGVFTAVVVAVVDRRFAKFEKQLRDEFVGKEEFDSYIQALNTDRNRLWELLMDKRHGN